MKKIALTVAVLSLLSILSPRARAEEGWVSLFDGKTLAGWKASENTDSWKIVEGELVCHGPRSHLFYDGDLKPFKNFEFKAEVMTTRGSNSGIYFHTRFQPEGWPKYGYEVQVNNTHKDPKKTGGLYGVSDVFEAPAKDGTWFEMHIMVQGKHAVVAVDGKKLVNYTEPADKETPKEGFVRIISEGTFALQAHDPASEVHYRNIRVKKLP